MDAIADLTRSNSLTDLAARIKAEHTAVSESLRESVRHGMVAGDLLVEAKAQLGHGQWLPWLREHCTISERTAQLYMRLAKNREAIEANTQCVADLTLSEAAALLFLSSDVRKVLNFARDCEGLSGDELIARCIAEGVGVIQTPGYDPFAGRTEAEKLEWGLFTLFQSFDESADRTGGEPERVADHVEWILQRPFQNVAEWLGEEGDKFRRQMGMPVVPDGFKVAWAKFFAGHSGWTGADIQAELETLQQRFKQARAEGRIFVNGQRPRRKRARHR